MCTSSYSLWGPTSFSYERSDDVNGASIVLVVAYMYVGVSFRIIWKVQQQIHVQWLWTLKVDFHVESLVCNICWEFQSLQASFLHLCSFIAYLPLKNNVQRISTGHLRLRCARTLPLPNHLPVVSQCSNPGWLVYHCQFKRVQEKNGMSEILNYHWCKKPSFCIPH